ncbi:MAG: metallophosphoesterase [Lachnospiraceae bacterium]|nr:metallophosphoesterase [Lachnospiraceae bacterium]
MSVLSVLGSVLIAAALVLLARSWAECRTLTVSEYECVSPVLPDAFDGYRVVFLSDLHGASFGAHNEGLASRIAALRPDLVLIGGDMVTVHPSGRTLKGCEALADLLDRLPDVPVLYAYGNHEARLTRTFPEGALLTARFEEILSERGIPVLRDRRVPVFRGQDCILVSAAEFGKEHYKKGFKRPLPEGFFTEKAGERDEGRFEILLAHCPLYLEDAAAWGADLTLSGHFHGGTVRLPWAGGVLTPQFQLFYPYCKGRFAFGRKTGIVSAGLGTHTINIRINNPPDIVTVVLKKER